MRTLLLLIATGLVARPASAAIVHDLVPSSETAHVNGLEFSDSGRFDLTNTLIRGPVDRYLDLAVDFDHQDAAGNIVYRPDNARWQLYVLDRLLPAPPESVLVEGLFVGHPVAIDLGGGRHEFLGDLVVATDTPDVFDHPGHIEVVFDTHLPLGHQVESGSLRIGEAFGSVPEPSSLALLGTGVVLGGLACCLRRS